VVDDFPPFIPTKSSHGGEIVDHSQLFGRKWLAISSLFSSYIGQYTTVWGIDSNLVGDFAQFRVHLGELFRPPLRLVGESPDKFTGSTPLGRPRVIRPLYIPAHNYRFLHLLFDYKSAPPSLPLFFIEFNMRTCQDCQTEKQVEAFEANRKVCKECRKQRRKLSVAKAKQTRIDANLPEIPSTHTCTRCQRTPVQGATFGMRPDGVSVRWKSMCHECFTGMGYDQTYRQRERAKDRDGYLAHQAANMRTWRTNNQAHHQQYMRDYCQSVSGKMSVVRTSAKQRGIAYDERDEDIFSELITRSCWYCDAPPTGVNGLDRLDSKLGYTRSNAVACCSVCNFMKFTLTVSAFLEKVSQIAQNVRQSHVYDASCMDMSTRMGSKGMTNPDRKKMMLTTAEQIKLKNDPCYLCGGPGGGIDRVDSTQCYRPDNCKGCCQTCNYMKKDYSLDFFVHQVTKIHMYNASK